MRTAKRVLSGVLLVAVVIGAVAIVLLLRPAEGPSGGAQQAAQDAPGYPVPPEGTAPPSPEGWYVLEATATCTLEPLIQTAEAVMALPTWTPLPTTTATLVPTAIPTLQPGSSAVLVNGMGPGDEPRIVRFTWNTSTLSLSEPVSLDTSIWSSRDRVYGMLPSPHGPYVAINAVHGDAGAEAYVLDVNDGTWSHRLPKEGFGRVLDWQPDGTRLLLQRSDQPGLPGRTVLVDASILQEESDLDLPRASLESYMVSSASFSPVGDTVAVAFVDGNTGNSEVWLTTVGGATRLVASTEAERIEYVDWSPRGEWIAMVTWSPGPDSTKWDYAARLWLLNPDDGELTLLASSVMSPGPALPLAPQWNAAGTRLAYLEGTRVPGQSELPMETSVRVWDAESRQVITITGEPHRLRAQLSWASDGSRLIYAEQSEPGRWALMAVDPGIADSPLSLAVADAGGIVSLNSYSRAVWLTITGAGVEVR